MKRPLSTFLFIVVFALVIATPALAQDTTPPEAVSPTIFAILTSAFTTLAKSVGVGAALSFLNQLGKMWLPKYFPNDSSDNWRLGGILVLTILVIFVPLVFPQTAQYLTILKLDQLGRDFAEFGALIIPLFVTSSKYFSELFYRLTLRGTFIGKSYTIENAKNFAKLGPSL